MICDRKGKAQESAGVAKPGEPTELPSLAKIRVEIVLCHPITSAVTFSLHLLASVTIVTIFRPHPSPSTL